MEDRGGGAASAKTRHDGRMSWLRRQSTVIGVVEDGEGRNLFGRKAERYESC